MVSRFTKLHKINKINSKNQQLCCCWICPVGLIYFTEGGCVRKAFPPSCSVVGCAAVLWASWMTDPDRKLCFSPLLFPSFPFRFPPLLFSPSSSLFGDQVLWLDVFLGKAFRAGCAFVMQSEKRGVFKSSDLSFPPVFIFFCLCLLSPPLLLPASFHEWLRAAHWTALYTYTVLLSSFL